MISDMQVGSGVAPYKFLTQSEEFCSLDLSQNKAKELNVPRGTLGCECST